MKTRTLTALMGATLLAASAAARAQDPRFYVGIAIGQSQMRNACAGAPSGLTCNDSDTAFRISLGHQATPHFAVEAGYALLGTVSASSGESADLSALDLSFLGSWPLGNRFALHGRIGLYHGEMEANGTPPPVTPVFPPPPPPPTRGWRSGGNEGATFGLGARYAITPTSAFRAEWQRYNRLGASGGPSVNVDLVSLGVLIRL